MKPSWRSLLLAALLSLPLPLDAAPVVIDESVSVRWVEIPVTVLRGGEPLRGLTARDFEVRIDRKPVTIQALETVDLELTEEIRGAPPVSVAARRHLLLLFDLAFSDPIAVVRARRAARQILDDLHPSDLVGVGLMRPWAGIELLLGFTSDLDQARLAVETLGAPGLLRRRPDSLGLVLGTRETGGHIDPGDRDSTRDIDLEVMVAEHLRTVKRRMELGDRQEDRRRILDMTRSFDQLAGMLASRQGRKLVIFLSEGFDTSTMLGDRVDDLETRRALESGELLDVDTSKLHGDTHLMNEFERAIEALRRADCVIQAVDISSFGGEDGGRRERLARRDGLMALAHDTHGELLENYTDLEEAMSQVLTRSSLTYLLVVSPDLDLKDGFHRIKVRLRDGPRGARVSHRAGFQSGKEAEDWSMTASGMILSGESGGSLPIDVFVTAFDRPDGPYVPVLIEIDGPSLLAGGETPSTEIHAYAIAEDGQIADFLTQAVRLERRHIMANGGLKFWGHLDLTPGEYSLRVLIRESSHHTYGLRRLELTVPSFDENTKSLLPPLFPDGAGRWLMVEESRQRRRRTEFPFMWSDVPFVPAARPTLDAGRETLFHVAGYGLGEAEPVLEALLLEDGGQTVTRSNLRILDRQEAPNGPTWYAVQLAATGIEAGDYTLVVSARDPLTGSSIHSSAPVLVARTP